MSNTLAAYIPHFLALSASSPFWLGQDTGLASSRSKIFEQLPTAGLPYQLSGWSEFEEFHVTWWRPGPSSRSARCGGTCGPCPTSHGGAADLRRFADAEEVAAIGALSQCLVEWMDGLCDRGLHLPHPASGSSGRKMARGPVPAWRRDHRGRGRRSRAGPPRHRGPRRGTRSRRRKAALHRRAALCPRHPEDRPLVRAAAHDCQRDRQLQGSSTPWSRSWRRTPYERERTRSLVRLALSPSRFLPGPASPAGTTCLRDARREAGCETGETCPRQALTGCAGGEATAPTWRP